jgi:ATP synthase protein I
VSSIEQPEISPQTDSEVEAGQLPTEPSSSMKEYYRLQRELLLVTLGLAAIISVSVWATYSLNTALNYVIGACTGVVYLRLLAKNVEQLGRQRKNLGSARLALLVGLILVASRLNQLEILPIFLGFLTYKAALMVYVLRTTVIPDSN